MDIVLLCHIWWFGKKRNKFTDAGNHKPKKKDRINSGQSSLKSQPLRVTLAVCYSARKSFKMKDATVQSIKFVFSFLCTFSKFFKSFIIKINILGSLPGQYHAASEAENRKNNPPHLPLLVSETWKVRKFEYI